MFRKRNAPLSIAGRQQENLSELSKLVNQANTSDQKAQYQLGRFFEEQKNLKRALQCYEPSAKRGYIESQIRLGYLLKQGFFKALPDAKIYKRQAVPLINESIEAVLNQGQFYECSYLKPEDSVFTLEEEVTADGAEFINPLDQAKGWLEEGLKTAESQGQQGQQGQIEQLQKAIQEISEKIKNKNPLEFK